MSQLNGDRARFQKNRKRRVLYRQRVRLLVARLRKKTDVASGAPIGSGSVAQDDGQLRAVDKLVSRGRDTSRPRKKRHFACHSQRAATGDCDDGTSLGACRRRCTDDLDVSPLAVFVGRILAASVRDGFRSIASTRIIDRTHGRQRPRPLKSAARSAHR